MTGHISSFIFYVSHDYFTLAYAVLPLKRVQIGQTYNVYIFVKKHDFFVLRSHKVKRMIPKHAMDLLIEKSPSGKLCTTQNKSSRQHAKFGI